MQDVIEYNDIPEDYGFSHQTEGIDLIRSNISNIELFAFEVGLINVMSHEYVLRAKTEYAVTCYKRHYLMQVILPTHFQV